MKTFCIVSFCNMYFTPYAKTYIDSILSSGNSVTLLYWDRDAANGENDCFPGCEKVLYQRKLTNASSKSEKLKGYVGATRFFRKVLSEVRFAGVILLQTHVAIACDSVLRKKYRNRYVVDIRDYTFERFSFYYRREKRMVESSYMSVISSPAYMKFLPQHTYVMAHNYTPYPQDVVDAVREKTVQDSCPIKISFIGKVRFIEMDKKLLQLFSGDERFRICYYGTGSEVLEQFCKENQITNTSFYGSFPPQETVSFYEKTNLINNLYGNHDPFLDYALSNKLYYAAQFSIPILVCPETYMEEVAVKYNIGFVLDIDDKTAPDRLYEWYRKFDFQRMHTNGDSLIQRAKEDNACYQKKIEDFIAGQV